MKHNDTKTARFLLTTLLVGVGLIWNGGFVFEAKATTTVTTSGDYTVLAPLPCIEGGGITCDKGNGSLQETVSFKTYVQYTINLLIGLSAVVAVVMIVWGGIEYMFTASFTGKKMGLEKVTHAIYGLVLILTSYIILRTIDPRLVEIPNTIVPKIEVQTWLQEDASALLTNKVINDSNRAVIENLEASKRIDAIRTEKTKVATDRASVTTQMEALDPSDPQFSEKMDRLELEADRLSAKNNDLEIEKQTETATIYFNGVLMKAITETVDSESNGAKMTYQQKIKKINEAKILLSKQIEDFRSKLVQLGQSDLSKLNGKAKTAQAELDLYILELVANSATVKYASDGMGIGGSSYKTSYVLATVSGADAEYKSKSDAVKYIQSEIAKIENVKKSLTDITLQNKLEQKITNLQNVIKANKTLN